MRHVVWYVSVLLKQSNLQRDACLIRKTYRETVNKMCISSILCIVGYTLNIRRSHMSGNRGCFLNSLLFLVIIFVPLLGHIIVSVMVLKDDHSLVGKLLCLPAISFMPIPLFIPPP